MTTRPPVCWNSFVFRFVRSDDRDELYSGNGFDGRLTYNRTIKCWCASLHGVSAVWEAEGPADHQGARLALEAAVVKLRERIAGAQQFLDRLAAEVG